MTRLLFRWETLPVKGCYDHHNPFDREPVRRQWRQYIHELKSKKISPIPKADRRLPNSSKRISCFNHLIGESTELSTLPAQCSSKGKSFNFKTRMTEILNYLLKPDLTIRQLVIVAQASFSSHFHLSSFLSCLPPMSTAKGSKQWSEWSAVQYHSRFFFTSAFF
jgi:hypothetical protein